MLLLKITGKEFLFDTGSNRKLLFNSTILGEPLTDLDGIILSYGHSDHVEGLRHLLVANTAIYATDNVQIPHHLESLNKFLYIGVRKSILSKIATNLHCIKRQLTLKSTLHIIPLGSTIKISNNLYIKKDNKLFFDDFSDELILIAEETDGLIVFNSCSHNDIVPMTETVF